jgi:2-C-methyl-D-erythritol 4-phosphate cytidylyltransferase
MKAAVVIVCAGCGKRLGKVDKSILELDGKPLFYHTYKVFSRIRGIDEIVIVLQQKHFKSAEKIIKDRRVSFVEGGRERKDSVYNGLLHLSEEIKYVLIHDGARPFVTPSLILDILRQLKKFPAVICGVESRDTLKVVEGGFVKKTLDRSNIFSIQTPQGFRKDLIIKAYEKLRKKNAFDDAQVVEYFGEKVKVIEGSKENIKITYPEDVDLAKAIIQCKIIN